MSISRIGNPNYVNLYNTNKVTQIDKDLEAKSADTIEISSLGKSLKEYSFDSNMDNSQKIDLLKSKIENGMYSVDPSLTAKSLLKAMKEN